MRQKWFSSLWYVQRKPCTYLASRLGLSLNGPKWASTWASSPRSTIGCIQNEIWAYGTIGANRSPILHWHSHHLQMDWNKIHRTHVTEEFHHVRPKRVLSLWYSHRKPCTYLASKLALSPNRPKRASSWALSPRSTIGCMQIDLWAYGTFGANRAPILHRH
jgi:hypothetical protein